MPNAEPLEPEVLASLEAIDATLHGDPVDPEHAELAELALILRDERPVPGEAFLARLDRRVEERFAAPPRRSRSWAGRWWRVSLPVAAGLAALAVVVTVVAGQLGVSGSPSLGSRNGSAPGAHSMSNVGASAGTRKAAASSPSAAASGAAGSAGASAKPTRAPGPRVARGR